MDVDFKILYENVQEELNKSMSNMLLYKSIAMQKDIEIKDKDKKIKELEENIISLKKLSENVEGVEQCETETMK
ncbi:TPA: hypothetical protein ACMVBE_000075 [Clostridioides difficile]|uniref:hypothetical protein n=1 Tax=unclassified Clostridioides TaxID=2635829 RepID=UPI00038CFEF9|nr:hypothetical protein QEW_0355 [Clostridioides difficile CD160]MCC0639881.1 hypothetical protein [Clostridioides sp. ES-S-0049-03]MCC0647865.1 hypothetical protein [Clostridioides sp. ZZV15-6598]MCC0653628.1 hypothetical protein [Clostridioides sp. ES-S-0001-03]MCC0762239.1 hypothetical protein [Clostridioides sp. ES-S-0006-03]MCE4722098.1 hypothetical protein [Clostridioides difficile]